MTREPNEKALPEEEQQTEQEEQETVENNEELEQQPDPDLMKSIPIDRRMKAFIQGDITLADMYAMNHEELYAIAEYGKMLFDEGKNKDAETVFTALTTLNPYDENFHTALASVYIKQERNEEAMIELERAIQLNQYLIPARVTRAELLLMQGRFEEVLKALEEIYALDPEGKEDATHRARGLAAAIATMASEAAEKKKETEGN